MAKRYDELADALDEISAHLTVVNKDYEAREYQLAASGLRTAESIPMNPMELDYISDTVRDSVAEWRAYEEIDKLEEFREKRPYVGSLTRIAGVGPKRAHTINKETGAESISDIAQISDELESISGIGGKTATTIRRSIAQLKR
jgi:DNA polymerase/3'-5' exonuclease PolX